jgi:hypothetical protein
LLAGDCEQHFSRILPFGTQPRKDTFNLPSSWRIESARTMAALRLVVEPSVRARS